jgi:hypothetical protein
MQFFLFEVASPSELAPPSNPAPPCEAHHAHPFEEEEVGLAVEC